MGNTKAGRLLLQTAGLLTTLPLKLLLLLLLLLLLF